MGNTRNSTKRKQVGESSSAPTKKKSANGTKSTAADNSKKNSMKRILDNDESEVLKEKAKGKQLLEDMEMDEAADIISNEEEEEEEEEGEDDIDWETIQLPPNFPTQEEQTPAYNNVEIVFEAPRPVLKNSYWEMAYQRNLRDWMHHSHVVLLFAHYKIRNQWCLSSELLANCRSIIPSHIQNTLTNKDEFITGVKWLLKWWNEDYFTLIGNGLSTIPYSDYETSTYVTNDIGKHGDYIQDLKAFINILTRVKSGTSDTSAQLFTALLRSCGSNVRLVCSLQPISYKIPAVTKKKEHQKEEQDNDDDSSTVLYKYRSKHRFIDPNVQLKQSKANPPIIWSEVYHNGRWICIDSIRSHIDKPLNMEPATLNRSNQLSYVLAFNQKNVIDLTSRYTLNLEKAIKQRERPLTKRELESGLKLWSTSFLDIITKHCKYSKQEKQEIVELKESQESISDKMPTTINQFKNHPLYVLQRHLKKFEILQPKEPVLGEIKGEKIYPIQCLKSISTADTYRKQGKQIKQGEQPIKMVKANAVTIEKRRLKQQAKQEGHDLMVACYGEWQTEPYIAPPVIDGKVPKNNYGNIDLFTESMLPKGAVHLPIKGIGKIAKRLNIDYADAVVDFDFIKMRATPVVNGIVIAEANEVILLEAWQEYDQHEIMKSIKKKEKEVYVRWRKLIKSLLIKSRIDLEYQRNNNNSNDDTVWTAFDNSNGGGGGFLPEEE